MTSTKITDISRDVLVCIIEWLTMDEALSLCRALRVTTCLAYQYATPPPPDYIFDSLVEYDMDGFLDTKDYYYNLLDDEMQKNNFDYLWKNKTLEAQSSLSDRFRLALVLNRVDQIKEFLKDERITDLNSHFVYGNSNKDVVKLFLEDHRCDPSQMHFLINAVQRGRLCALELLLLDKRVDPSKDNNRALRNAVDMGQKTIVEMLLNHPKVNPADAENHALISAAERGYVDILKLLLADSRIDPSADGNEAIICAAAKGHLGIVELLLADARVNPASRRNRALNRAIENMHQEVAQALLADPRVMKKGNKPKVLLHSKK